MRLLLVDDEDLILLTLSANLELDGFEVTTASSGAHALELMGQQDFDLMLSDVRMPGMDGVELFRRIRQVRPDLPCILMTGFALEELVRDAIREGVFTVLPKPSDMSDVVAALTSVRAAHCSDVERALAIVADGSVDVCVVDMNLPSTGAAALMEQIHRIDPSIVQIAVAGHDVADLMRKAATRGSFACMRKPLRPEELLEVIARARGTARSRATR
jgi:DNA-binding NtrC family response regulator